MIIFCLFNSTFLLFHFSILSFSWTHVVLLVAGSFSAFISWILVQNAHSFACLVSSIVATIAQEIIFSSQNAFRTTNLLLLVSMTHLLYLLNIGILILIVAILTAYVLRAHHSLIKSNFSNVRIPCRFFLLARRRVISESVGVLLSKNIRLMVALLHIIAYFLFLGILSNKHVIPIRSLTHINNILMQMSFGHLVVVELLLFLLRLIYRAHSRLNWSAFYFLVRLSRETMEHTGIGRTSSRRTCLGVYLSFTHLIVLVIVVLMILSVNLRNLNWWCGHIILLLHLSIHGVTGSWLRLSRIFLPRWIKIADIGTSLLCVQQLIVLLDTVLWNGWSIHIDSIESFDRNIWIVAVTICSHTIIANPRQRLLPLLARIHLISLVLSYLTNDHAHIIGRERQSILLTVLALVLTSRSHLLILNIHSQVFSTRRLSWSYLQSSFCLIWLLRRRLLSVVTGLVNEIRLIARLTLILLWCCSDNIHDLCSQCL